MVFAHHLKVLVRGYEVSAMKFSQRLEIRQGQSLVMTPQLLQAIKLLQLPTLDLAQFIEQELESNPLLERASEDDGPDTAALPLSLLFLVRRRREKRRAPKDEPPPAPL